MSKLMKSLTLGVAAAALVVATSTANAYCPRGGGYYKGGYSKYYGGYYKKKYYKKKYYKKKYYKKAYYKKPEYGYEKPHDKKDKVEDVAEGDTEGPEGRRDGPDDRDVADFSESRLFEIVEKERCDERGCESLTLRDPEGVEIEISGFEYADEMMGGTSEEELNYHLAQNGSALRGRLEEVREDGEITYKFICEKIYS